MKNSTMTDYSKRRPFAVRANETTPAIVDQIAKDLGCFRITGEGVLAGACGVMLDKIASGDLKVVVSEQKPHLTDP
jgi:hypothetical protein